MRSVASQPTEEAMIGRSLKFLGAAVLAGASINILWTPDLQAGSDDSRSLKVYCDGGDVDHHRHKKRSSVQKAIDRMADRAARTPATALLRGYREPGAAPRRSDGAASGNPNSNGIQNKIKTIIWKIIV